MTVNQKINPLFFQFLFSGVLSQKSNRDTKQGSLSSFSCFLQTQVIKVYSEDETSRALEVPSDITARDVCQLLILKNHYVDDNSWTLFEHLTLTGVGKETGLLSNSVPSGYTTT